MEVSLPPNVRVEASNEKEEEGLLGPKRTVPDIKSRISALDFETPELLHAFESHRSNQKRLEVVQAISGEEDILYVDGVLSEEECGGLIQAINANTSLSFWSAKGRESAETRSFRDVDTVEVNYHSLADELTRRLESCLHVRDMLISNKREEKVVEGKKEEEEQEEESERDMIGRWIYSRLNHDLLFSRYPPQGAFAPHTDGRSVHSFDCRSFFSVIVFLNTIPPNCGGGTRFYRNMEAIRSMRKVGNIWTSDPRLVTVEVAPVAGRLLLFEQHLVHEGIPPSPPHCKYIIRSDLMFERTPPLLQSEQDKEAYRIFQLAEVLSESGQIEDSIAHFRRAIKLSPILASTMGLG